MENRRWIAFFSQTGSELLQVCRAINTTPNIVITNNTNFIHTHFDLIDQVVKDNHTFIILPNRPLISNYQDIMFEGDFVTLHGWLRILPEFLCFACDIYNGHPGLITKYPELKGQDPQKKAFELGLKTSGCVIHKVTEGIDEGEVIREQEVNIDNLSLDDIIKDLHKISVEMWTNFLMEQI